MIELWIHITKRFTAYIIKINRTEVSELVFDCVLCFIKSNVLMSFIITYFDITVDVFDASIVLIFKIFILYNAKSECYILVCSMCLLM